MKLQNPDTVTPDEKLMFWFGALLGCGCATVIGAALLAVVIIAAAVLPWWRW